MSSNTSIDGDSPPGIARYSAADRNKPFILECLQKYISPASDRPQCLLEVASGMGQHAAHFAPHFPHVTFQPTELEPHLIKNINAFRNHLQIQNMKDAAILDVSEPASTWLNGALSQHSVDYVLSINLVHISPWTCSQGLFEGASYLLRPGGYLFMYGPFAVDGHITPESNVNFDRLLRSQDQRWGLRDVTRQLTPLASGLGLRLAYSHDLPANNKFLAWLKQSS